MVKYAASLKGPVRFGTNIQLIDRMHHPHIITYTQGGFPQAQACAKLVLAFPPNVDALEFLHMPLSSQEHTVLSKVGITAYWSSAVETKLDFPQAYLQTPSKSLSDPVGFLRTSNASPIATTWSWAAMGSNLSLESVTELLVNTFIQVQVRLGKSSPVITTDDVKEIRKWDYFSHFSTVDLQPRIYKKYNLLQGQQNTYYTSELNGFKLVEFAIQGGKDLVQMFF